MNSAYHPEAFQDTLRYVKEDLQNLCQSNTNHFDDFFKLLETLQRSYCKGHSKAKIRRFLRFISIKTLDIKSMVNTIATKVLREEIEKLENERWLKTHQVIDELNKVLTNLTKASDMYIEMMNVLDEEFLTIKKKCAPASLMHCLIVLLSNNLTILHGNNELQFKTISENLNFVVSKMGASRMFYDHFAKREK